MFRAGDTVELVFDDDADTATAEVERPDGTVEALTPTASDGQLTVAFTAAQAGRYVVSCTGSRTLAEVVNVQAARPGALASLAELKAHMNMTDTAFDDELREHLEAASVVVEQHVGQALARRTVVGERHVVGRKRPVVLKHVPVLSLTSVTARSGTAPALEDIELIPETGELRPIECGAELYGDLVVDYVAGHAAVPQNYVLAALIIASHLYELQHPATPGVGGFSITGSSEDSLAASSRGFALPNRALELLGGRPPSIA